MSLARNIADAGHRLIAFGSVGSVGGTPLSLFNLTYTNNGSYKHKFTFINAPDDANYVVVANPEKLGSYNQVVTLNVRETTYFELWQSNTGDAQDTDGVHVAVFA
jgi:hypothetical protein